MGRGLACLAIVGALGLAGMVGGCASSSSLGSLRGALDPKSIGPDAVVMAWPAKGEPPHPAGGKVHVRQTAKGFEPHVAVVSAGASVVFENKDAVYHNAFCVQKESPFDVGTYAPGQTRGVRMKTPGTYQVFCELHSKESAYIVVTPGPWHTRPGSDGTFELDDVPIGKYQVRVWQPNKKDLLGTAEVKPKQPATVRFEGVSR